MICPQSNKQWGRIMDEGEFDQCEECGKMLPYNGGEVPAHSVATTEEETLEPSSEWDKMVAGFGDRLSITVVGR